MLQIGVTLGNNWKRFIGTSDETKPTDCGPGSEVYEADTKTEFIYDGSKWWPR